MLCIYYIKRKIMFRQRDLTVRELLFFLERRVRGDHQRPHADRERLTEHDDPAEPRFPPDRMTLLDRPDLVGLEMDVAGGLAHGDGPMVGSAHHDALDEGLTAGEVRRGLVAHSRLALLLRGGLRPLRLLVAPLEPLHATTRVHELLLARVEGVAVRADVGTDLAHGRPRLERVPAGTVHVRDLVLRMDALLHRCRLLARCGLKGSGPRTDRKSVV